MPTVIMVEPPRRGFARMIAMYAGWGKRPC